MLGPYAAALEGMSSLYVGGAVVAGADMKDGLVYDVYLARRQQYVDRYAPSDSA